jgi:PAS domain S-box-containing protein
MTLPNDTDASPAWPGQTVADGDKSRDQLIEELAVLRQQVAQLEATERKLQAIFDIVPVGISILNQERQILEANPALEEIVGMRQPELAQELYQREIYIKSDGTPFPPEEFPSVRVLNEKRVIQAVEIGIVKEDDNTIWTSVNAAPLPPPNPGVVVATTDVTQRKRAEEALQRANKQLEQRVNELLALNYITQMVATVTDLPTVLNTVAKAMSELFNVFSASISLYNMERRERKIVTMYDPYHPERAGLVGFTVPLQDDPLNIQLVETGRTIIVPQPQTHPLMVAYHHLMKARNVESLMLIPLLARGTLIGNIGLSSREPGREFTPAEATLAETVAGQLAGAIETARLFDEAQRAREAAEAANRAKTEFLANVSHELRTPLNGVLGYTQMLRREPAPTPLYQEGLAIIQRNGEYLLTLINDILDLSKIEAGKMELYAVEFNLPYFLESIVDIFRVQAQQKKIGFVYVASPALPSVVQGDEKRLRQVLINLLGNAVKFTEKGEVTFTVTPVAGEDQSPLFAGSETEKPQKQPLSQRVRFQIQDTGPGIKPEDLDKIFVSFQQLGPHLGQVAGTGLGLSISRRLMDMMGGTLQVESRLGEGSTFWVEVDLPLAEGWSLLAAGLQEQLTEQLPHLVGLPVEEAARLLALTKIGDIHAIWQHLTSLEQLGTQYQPFVAELRQLADSFQIDKIQEIISTYLEASEE